jgi:uncharacterized protein (TIGR04222 family)
MNPFDLRGPEFLLFYLGLSIATLVAVVVLRRSREPGRQFPQPKLSDPYLIGYLRGGPSAAIESAVVSLIDRGLIDISDDRVRCNRHQRGALLTDPLERAIVEELGTPRRPKDLGSMKFPEVFSGYARKLSMLGLVADTEEKSARLRDTLAGCIFLAVVAGIKIAVALSRGRTNIILLVILSILAVIVVIILGNPRTTQRGKNVVEDLRTLFKGLQSRAESLTPGRSAGELALVSALFGAYTLPVSAFPMREKLFPQPPPSSGSDGSSSSSCGSSSSSSCSGSSCGGGGGCGGCGS